MPTKKKIRVTFGNNNVLNCQLPEGWHQLTQSELQKALNYVANLTIVEAKLLFFFRLTHISMQKVDVYGYICSVHDDSGERTFRIRLDDLCELMELMSWMESTPSVPVRLNKIGGSNAMYVPECYGLPFEKYLEIENLYQSYLVSHKADCLDDMAALLYDDPKNLDDASRLNVFQWWAGLKNLFSQRFTSLFRPSGGSSTIDQYKLMQIVNAQIRALTGGDITKYDAVMHSDTWTAITELDAKAADAERQRREYEKMKNKK